MVKFDWRAEKARLCHALGLDPKQVQVHFKRLEPGRMGEAFLAPGSMDDRITIHWGLDDAMIIHAMAHELRHVWQWRSGICTMSDPSSDELDTWDGVRFDPNDYANRPDERDARSWAQAWVDMRPPMND